MDFTFQFPPTEIGGEEESFSRAEDENSCEEDGSEGDASGTAIDPIGSAEMELASEANILGVLSTYPMQLEGRIISWNCRGARSSEFQRNAKEILRRYRPVTLIILEPRIRGTDVDEAYSKLGKTDWAMSEAAGFSGGVWVLWNRADITLKIIHVRKFFILPLVHRNRLRDWELTAVYASPDARRKFTCGRSLRRFKFSIPGFVWVTLIVLWKMVRKQHLGEHQVVLLSGRAHEA